MPMLFSCSTKAWFSSGTFQQHGFRDLDFEPLGREAGIRQRGADHLEYSSSLNWTGDRLTATSRSAGAACVLARVPDHPFAERYDQPGLLRKRNELVRRDQPRVDPPAHHASSRAAAAEGVDERLVVHFELAPRDSVAQSLSSVLRASNSADIALS